MNIKSGGVLKRKLNYLSKYILRILSRQEELKVFGEDENSINAIYVLNLDNQKKRWSNIKAEVKYQKVLGKKDLGHFTQRFSAINGAVMDLENVSSAEIETQYSLEEYYKMDPDPRLLSILRFNNLKINLTRPEIAIALSHVEMWRKMIEEKRSYALFLEDDIFFENDFAHVLNQVWDELPKDDDSPDFDFLYLSYEEVKSGMIKEDFSNNLVKPQSGLWWFSGYVLSLAGAKKLLAELPVRAPVDVWINFIFDKLNVYAVKRPIINQREDIESDNVYSILSMLNQAKKEFDKRKGKAPVFVLGKNDTVTNAFGEVLVMLGYQCCINRWGEFAEEVNQSLDNERPLLFEAYCGFEDMLIHHKKIKRAYPNALFIIGSDDNGITQKDNIEYPRFDEVSKSIAANDENTSITIDIDELNNWDVLCHFLDCEVPDFTLPKHKLIQKARDSRRFSLESAILKPVQSKTYKNLDFDQSPWILPIDKLNQHHSRTYPTKEARIVGNYKPVLEDDFSKFDDSKWIQLEDTFEGNLALFSKENFSLLDNNGCSFTLRPEKTGHRDYTSASILTQEDHQYGRFEVEMKPAKGNGIVSAFFLFRYNPWQEIDFEFLGDDTTKVMLNIYYNPGVEDVMYNFGNKSAPIKIDLGFDASDDYHKYAIEWEPHEVRWYIDGDLVHVRSAWAPTLIPDLPMQFYFNIWAPASKDFAGSLANTKLPQSSYVRNVKIYSWSH